jgi:hypothetical protein
VLVAGEDASTRGQGVPRRLPPRAVAHPRCPTLHEAHSLSPR